MIPIIRLPRSMQLSLESTAQALLQPPGGRRIDFSRPLGEAALVPPDSTSWRILKNPIALLVGGMAAVILELAEPAVPTGVLEHSAVLTDPTRRPRPTRLAPIVAADRARHLA